MNATEKIKSELQNLPDKPGIYQFFDKEGKIIYIGKAKSLKKRVSSYFNRQNYENAKLKILVRRIFEIRHIIVDTESDALLLENSLIKKYQPRYNINLKDDKTFPWICIKNEDFPRVFTTRTRINDGSVYFGPYTSAFTVRTLLELIREIYPLRTCKLKLTEENISENKFKVCLEYHLGNCKGPCVGLQNHNDYQASIDQIKSILKGGMSDVINHLKVQMQEFSKNFQYEEAGKVKEKIRSLEKFQLKSTVVNPKIDNLEVFSIVQDEKNAYVNYLKVKHGSIVQAQNVEIVKKLEETKEDLLSFVILDIRDSLKSDSPEIILPFILHLPGINARIKVPEKGDKVKLLELSLRNAKYFMLDKKKQAMVQNPIKALDRKLETMKSDLHLSQNPVHIECFDNSNIQGTNPVAACVVFKNLKPAKKDYRHYNIKTVVGADDFGSMKEVIYRRYKRLLEENETLPQLIVVDGGKGQLSSAVSSLEKLNLRDKIAIIGIAKRLEEIYFPGDSVPLYLDKNSESLKVIQALRNEAHRFGINFHRQKRSGSMISSELETISGIGDKTIEILIAKFGSVESLKKARYSEVVSTIGEKKANLMWKSFNLKTT
ncbi:MAG: excinuclease ABC subunit UvrC [Bacteroidales bacterium]|nr:excinuclease ABC subunit UvrC [Bacteroidales bacterium]MCF8389667.1 excinuclease ABC subunit UvrC [Bacteroidales bacterium]